MRRHGKSILPENLKHVSCKEGNALSKQHFQKSFQRMQNISLRFSEFV